MLSYSQFLLSGETRKQGNQISARNEIRQQDLEMSAFIANWFFLAVVLVCWGMHLFGHRHHGHGHRRKASVNMRIVSGDGR